MLRFKLYDTAMTLIEVDPDNQPVKEITFNYNEYVDETGVVLVSKFHGLLNEFVGRTMPSSN